MEGSRPSQRGEGGFHHRVALYSNGLASYGHNELVRGARAVTDKGERVVTATMQARSDIRAGGAEGLFCSRLLARLRAGEFDSIVAGATDENGPYLLRLQIVAEPSTAEMRPCSSRAGEVR